MVASTNPDPSRGLHDLVLRCVPKLVDHLEAQDRYLPAHAVRYLDRFGHCGDPTLGFALLRCDCGGFRLLPFRCKARGLCPTCGGRAMASGAAHLVDRVLPDVTVRQWVLSVPWPRRYLFARKPELCAGARRRVWRALNRWYARRASALGAPGGSTGTVVVVQRFGSALNLNVHFHMLLLDGVFVEDSPAKVGVCWVKVPAPSTDEVQALVTELARDLEAWLDREGYGTDEACDEDDDPNGTLFAASIAGRVAMGRRAGARVRRMQGAPARPFRLPPRCGEAHGYNLHAAVVIGRGNREGLERLCRYVLRPPLARTRLHRRGDGLLVLTLRKPYANGTTDFLFSEVELAQRLAALVPPARKNSVSYRGVLAPRHRFRNHVIPEPPAHTEERTRLTKKPRGRSRWHPWADLLWRVFGVDGLACACGGRLVLHAIVQPPATLNVLDSLRRSANRNARAPPMAS